MNLVITRIIIQALIDDAQNSSLELGSELDWRGQFIDLKLFTTQSDGISQDGGGLLVGILKRVPTETTQAIKLHYASLRLKTKHSEA
jgi:hypothetical protein